MRIALFVALGLSGMMAPAEAAPPNVDRKATSQQVQTITNKQAPANKATRSRRCAYLGQWGSFHIIGPAGTAAYNLGRDQFIANLSFAGEDANFWMYRPSKGDPLTTLWAFARKPDCGRYWVWRFENGTWKQYEATRAWGEGFGQTTVAETLSTDVAEQFRLRFDELEGRVDKLEKRDPGL